jgi:hypothetical protein
VIQILPAIRCGQLISEYKKGLLIDEIYPKILKEHHLKEQLHACEGAHNVFLRLLTVGVIKEAKDTFYL